ncbi:hypoxanthine phosphoribosyltransferase [candidate division KSB1 bacterium]|nr:hypoxanthine phosphoribosyltransferase [candidate division KSB1 bacterium]
MTDIKYISSPQGKYRELITEKQIKHRVQELAKKISEDYSDKCPIIIGVLNGAFIFMADFIRELTIDCEVDFVKISSYHGQKSSSGLIRLLKDFDCHVDGRHVIVVEDIADSGRSIQFLAQMFKNVNPESVKFVSLLLKEGGAVVDFNIDYVGFKIPNEFVVGYGLDYDQKYRNLSSIYILE